MRAAGHVTLVQFGRRPLPGRAWPTSVAAALDRLALGALLLLCLTFIGERASRATDLTAEVRTPDAVHGALLTNLRLVLLVALAAWALSCAAARRWPRMPSRLAAVAGVWFLVLLVSALAAPSLRGEALRSLARPAAGLVLAWAIYDLAATLGRQQLLARTLALAGIAVAVIGLGEAAAIPPLLVWLDGFRTEPLAVNDVDRISSTLAQPNIAAVVLEMTLPLVLAWWLTSRGRLARFALGVGLLAIALALVLTFSRAGASVLLLSLAAMAVFAALRQAWRVSLAAGAGVALIVLAGAGALGVLLLQQQPIARRLGADFTGHFPAVYQAPASLAARPGELLSVPVRVTNTGTGAWSSQRPDRIGVGYHLETADRRPMLYEGVATALPTAVPPGQGVQVDAQVAAPSQPGSYVLVWDGLLEWRTWFSWGGTPTAPTQLVVAGEPVAGTAVSAPGDLALPAWGRSQCWSAAWAMLREHPVLGVGFDNFTWQFREYSGVQRGDACFHAHSLYLEQLADTGILGLAASLVFFATLLVIVWRCVWVGHRPALEDRAWVWRLALATALLAWFLHASVEYFYRFWPTAIGFWLVAGLAVRMAASRPPAGAPAHDGAA